MRLRFFVTMALTLRRRSPPCIRRGRTAPQGPDSYGARFERLISGHEPVSPAAGPALTAYEGETVMHRQSRAARQSGREAGCRTWRAGRSAHRPHRLQSARDYGKTWSRDYHPGPDQPSPAAGADGSADPWSLGRPRRRRLLPRRDADGHRLAARASRSSTVSRWIGGRTWPAADPITTPGQPQRHATRRIPEVPVGAAY